MGRRICWALYPGRINSDDWSDVRSGRGQCRTAWRQKDRSFSWTLVQPPQQALVDDPRDDCELRERTNSFVRLWSAGGKLQDVGPLLPQAPAIQNLPVTLLKVVELQHVGGIQQPAVRVGHHTSAPENPPPLSSHLLFMSCCSRSRSRGSV